MDQITLKAELKDKNITKAGTKILRRTQKIPAVVYGGKKEPVSVVVLEEDLVRVVRSGGTNAIVKLEHPGGSDTVILKAIQHHAVTDRPIHIDFQRISMKEKIEVKVPLKIVGEAPGVKLHGGILEHILRELKIRCLPTQIPHEIPVDVSSLDIAHGLMVKDLNVAADLEVLEDPQHMVVNVVVPAEEEVAPVPVAAEGAAAEPEVIAKGKKEEGTEEAAAASGAPKPAEKGKAAPAPAATAPAQKK
ncbi:MAG: 50S ribosomal protein L25 [Elusimicrobia bacterium]|nr:50S ribosomal protein L25 [Elusimicrobiota bacterium]